MHNNRFIVYVLIALLLLQFCFIELSFAQPVDPVKDSITNILRSFQGRVGDGIVIAAIAGLLVAVFRRAFKTALGCLVLIGGIVILRISIAVLF